VTSWKTNAFKSSASKTPRLSCVVLLRCSDVLTCACFLRLDRAAVFRPEARTAAVVRVGLARHSRHCRRSALPSQEAPRTVFSQCLCVSLEVLTRASSMMPVSDAVITAARSDGQFAHVIQPGAS
jgi:hypothetical protein